MRTNPASLLGSFKGELEIFLSLSVRNDFTENDQPRHSKQKEGSEVDFTVNF